MTAIKEHFEEIAQNYDYWKKKNWYYYDQLQGILKEKIPPGKKVLEIGCGTGDLLVALHPSKGLGVDISKNMIKIAKEKHKKEKNIIFQTAAAEHLNIKEAFDAIILADVIEHLEKINQMAHSLNKIATSDTTIFLTMINPLWEPILLIAEKLSLKMPEGPHHRLPFHELKKIFKKHSLETPSLEYRILFPKNIPLISDFVNKHFYKVPLIRLLGFVQVLTIKKI